MSEIARLMAQIQAENEAAQRALTDLSIIAPHQFINRRMERVEQLRKELVQEAGEAEAKRIFVELCNQETPEAGDKHASL